jgi:type IV fimbrial biogenesis protein FimT
MNECSQTRNRDPRIPSGITAIELLIGLAVLVIVALLAIPGSSMLIESYRLKAASSQLVDGLYLARSEAQNRGSTVKVCPSDDGRSCRTDGDWSHGWLVFSDGNDDGVVQEIELLEAFEAPGAHVRIVASGAAQKAAGFTSAGLVRDNGSASGEFILCTENSRAASRVIEVDSEGWVSLASNDRPECETG